MTNRDGDRSRVDAGPEWFRKLFEKLAHDDDWGVPCTYDYAAWKLCKTAMRRARRTSDRQRRGEVMTGLEECHQRENALAARVEALESALGEIGNNETLSRREILNIVHEALTPSDAASD